MKETIAKSDWLAAGQCLTMAWRGLRAAGTAPTEAELFRMEQGREVGALARRLYPKGGFVSKTEGKTTAEGVRDLLGNFAAAEVWVAPFHLDHRVDQLS